MPSCRCGSICTARGCGGVGRSKAPRPRGAMGMGAGKRGLHRGCGGWNMSGSCECPFSEPRNLETHRAPSRRCGQEKSASYCFYPTAELEARRAAAEKDGVAWKYDRLCLRLAPDEVHRRLAEGRPAVVRF